MNRYSLYATNKRQKEHVEYYGDTKKEVLFNFDISRVRRGWELVIIDSVLETYEEIPYVEPRGI